MTSAELERLADLGHLKRSSRDGESLRVPFRRVKAGGTETPPPVPEQPGPEPPKAQ